MLPFFLFNLCKSPRVHLVSLFFNSHFALALVAALQTLYTLHPLQRSKVFGVSSNAIPSGGVGHIK